VVVAAEWLLPPSGCCRRVVVAAEWLLPSGCRQVVVAAEVVVAE